MRDGHPYIRCENCRHWEFISLAREGSHYSRGLCLRHAPQPADEERGKSLADYCGTWFPETDSDDRCGEFQPVPLTVLVTANGHTVWSEPLPAGEG